MAQPQDAAAQRRARQTLINLLLALAATVAIALALVMVVPRDDSNLIKPVDFKSIAANVETSEKVDVVSPAELPTGWWSNAARWKGSPADGVKSWHVGFVGPKNQYIGVDQAFNINPTWLAQKLVGFELVQTMASYGDWSVSKYKGTTDKNRNQPLWVELSKAGQAVFVTGTASQAEFAEFAKLLKLHFN